MDTTSFEQRLAPIGYTRILRDTVRKHGRKIDIAAVYLPSGLFAGYQLVGTEIYHNTLAGARAAARRLIL